VKLRDVLDAVLERHDLTTEQATALLIELTQPEVPAAQVGALLAGLRCKGVTAAELRGLALGMRSLARRPAITDVESAVDIVGTGGDKSGSFNLSTGASLLAAAAGLRVVKHGNRSVSSRAGSADVLEALGLPLPLDEQRAGECLRATGFTFLFAPHFHPAMKAIAPVRAAMGVRTVFNILGPLSNPAAPGHYVIGAYSEPVARLMAEALAGMPLRRAFVIHGAGGWDEPTPLGAFLLLDVRNGRVHESRRGPQDYGLAVCTEQELMGGEAPYNAAALQRVLRGAEHGGHRDALVLGAALALEVTGAVADPLAAAGRAAEAIDSGAAAHLLAQVVAFGAEGRS
jgi:anthranilate phosphoribosyltransferase